MASDTQIRQRTAVQLARVLETAGRLADRFPDVNAPDIPTRLRYPEMLPLMQLTAIGDFLEAVNGATDFAAEKHHPGTGVPMEGIEVPLREEAELVSTEGDPAPEIQQTPPAPKKGKAS